jgi:hypothetical protein
MDEPLTSSRAVHSPAASRAAAYRSSSTMLPRSESGLHTHCHGIATGQMRNEHMTHIITAQQWANMTKKQPSHHIKILLTTLPHSQVRFAHTLPIRSTRFVVAHRRYAPHTASSHSKGNHDGNSDKATIRYFKEQDAAKWHQATQFCTWKSHHRRPFKYE